MMRADKFIGSLIFAAIAGLSTVPYLLAAAPVLGLARALALGSVFGLAGYVAVVSPDVRRGLRYAALALALGLGLLLAAPSMVVLFGAAILLGLLRSGLLYRAKVGRALWIESTLFVAAVVMAKLLAGGSFLSYGLAVWGFFLVESTFFLFAGARPRRASAPDEDPFERACREAKRLLEELPG